MTIGEIERYIQSYNRRKRNQAKITAINNYILADLIGASIGRLYKGTYPKIEEVYPSLFRDSELTEEAEQDRRDEISVRNFMNFAKAYNQKFIGGEKKE